MTREMTRLEQVSAALISDPPTVLGIRDGGKIRPLVAWDGSGARRTFRFDLGENLLYTEVIKRHRDIVLPGEEG